jgi:hypothetical protein
MVITFSEGIALINVEVRFVSIPLSISILSVELTLKATILSVCGFVYALLAYLYLSQAWQSESSITHQCCQTMSITS